jgi:streptogramin lyase
MLRCLRALVFVICLSIVSAPLAALAVKITEFPTLTPAAGPYTIITVYGKLWFVENLVNKIGVMTTSGGMTEYTIPQAGSGPQGLALGQDGNIWFSQSNLGSVSTVDPFGGFGTPITGFVTPGIAAAGSDGRVWFVDSGADEVVAVKAAANGPATQHLTAGVGSDPLGLALSPDGPMYFLPSGTNKIGSCVPGFQCGLYDGTLTASAGLRRAAFDLGGQYIWFTERTANKIGKMGVSGGTITEYTVPTASSAPLGICAGPDGNMWFTEQLGNKIGRITPDGVITEFPIPTANSGPTGITLGPDGNLYFVENSASKIGKLEVFISGDLNADGTVSVLDVFYLISFLFAGGPAPK